MAQYLLLRKISFDNAQALQCEAVIGTPALTQYNGFIDRLHRFLYYECNLDIKFQDFAVAYHDCELVNTVTTIGGKIKTYTIPCALTMRTSEMRPATPKEKWKVNGTVSLLIKVETNEVEEDIVYCLEDAFEYFESRCDNFSFCGGTAKMSDKTSFELIVSNDHSKDDEIKAKLMPSHLAISREDLLIGSNKQPLERMVDIMKRGTKETIDGWFAPLVVGYTRLNQYTSSDNHNKEHWFVDTLTTLVEYRMPISFNTVDDFLWHYDFNGNDYKMINNFNAEKEI